MPHMPKFLVIALTLAMTGCASMTSNPWLKEALTRPETSKLSSDAERTRLSFIGSAMMEKDDRIKLFAEVANRTAKSGWGAFESSTFAQMTTDAIVGDLGSQVGSDVGMAVFAGAAVFGAIFDGSMDRASQIWLPTVVNGRPIRTVEDANRAADEAMHNKITGVAKTLGWSVQCLTRCPSDNQIVALRRPADQANPGYEYWPSEVIAVTSRMSMEPVPAEHPIRAVLGKNVAWQSPHGNTAFIELYSGAKRDSSGQIKILKADDSEYRYPFVTEDLSKTHLGRDLQRLLHVDGLSFVGSKDTSPNTLVYGGQIYGFWSNSDTRMISMRVDEANLLNEITR